MFIRVTVNKLHLFA